MTSKMKDAFNQKRGEMPYDRSCDSCDLLKWDTLEKRSYREHYSPTECYTTVFGLL